ncbi:MAG: hypothetical protein ACI8XO_001810 [Verrucomicrobiales bacterium]|jgi:hypothetical protein
MLTTLMWLGGVFLGYAIFMSQTPLRSYFSDAFGLVRERGNAHVWLLAGMLSLAGASLDLWRHYDGGEVFTWGAALTSPELPAIAKQLPARGARGLGDLFSTVASGGSREIGGGARGVMVGWLGALLLAAAALVLQYYSLLFLYVRISSPSKKIRLGKLLELALRRFGRTWPLLPICWIVWAMPFVGGISVMVLPWWWIGIASFFIVFAFLQVGVLSGERDLKEAVGFNFACWRSGGLAAGWFMVIALVNLCVFALAEVTVERSIAAGSFPGIALKLAFVFGRAFILVWILGAWLLMFCDQFIGPRKPRPK